MNIQEIIQGTIGAFDIEAREECDLEYVLTSMVQYILEEMGRELMRQNMLQSNTDPKHITNK